MKVVQRIEFIVEEGDVKRIKQPFIPNPCYTKCNENDRISCCGCQAGEDYINFQREMEESGCWDFYLAYHDYLNAQKELGELKAKINEIEDKFAKVSIPLSHECKFVVHDTKEYE